MSRTKFQQEIQTVEMNNQSDNMSCDAGFPISVDTNRPVQSLNYAGCLKFPNKEGEELYYPCGENKFKALISNKNK